VNTFSLINCEFSDRALWSRILSEAEHIRVNEAFLALVISDIITKRRDLADAIISRIASLLSPPASAPSLQLALRSLLDQDGRILAGTAFDMAAVLDRDPATTKAIHVLLHAKGFLALQTHRFAHALWKCGNHELALHLQACTSRSLQVDIHPAARLGVGDIP